MYAPLALKSDSVASASTTKIDQPAAVGDKQLVYLTIFNTTGGTVGLGKTGDATGMGFPIGAGEAWMAGPVLGDQIESWGLNGSAPTGVNVLFVSGDLKVDPRRAPLSVHDEPATTSNVGFTWQQII